MSSAPRLPNEFGYSGLRMTAVEFLAIGETRERMELVDGVVCMSPSASLPHQRLVREILFQLETFRRANSHVEVFADVDVVLASGTVYRPDVIAYADKRVVLRTDRAEAAPTLVVEVLSPATRAFDLTTKRDDYERAGVAEYMVVESSDAGVRLFRRDGEWLVELPVRGDSLTSSGLAGFVLDLKALRTLVG